MSTTHISEPTEQNAKSKVGQLLETISLRDYFAAKAMQAFIQRAVLYADLEDVAIDAYDVADKMLNAREEGGAE